MLFFGVYFARKAQICLEAYKSSHFLKTAVVKSLSGSFVLHSVLGHKGVGMNGTMGIGRGEYLGEYLWGERDLIVAKRQRERSWRSARTLSRYMGVTSLRYVALRHADDYRLVIFISLTSWMRFAQNRFTTASHQSIIENGKSV